MSDGIELVIQRDLNRLPVFPEERWVPKAGAPRAAFPPFVARAAAVAERLSGQKASFVPLSPGSLPIVYSLERHVGVPGLSAPDNPVYGGCAAHAPNEHIRVRDVAPALRYFAALLDELG